MFNIIDSKIERYRELEQLLADPEVIKNQKQYQAYAKELARLSNLVSLSRKYKEIEQELSDTKELVDGKDAELAEMAQAEHQELENELAKLKSKIEELLIEPDPDLERNAIIEIRAGTGGREAAIFAGDLYRMYSKYAGQQRLKIEIMSSNPGESGGFKEIIFAASGTNAYGHFKFESGVHRVQRVPDTEAQGRIHTSAVSVAVLPEAEEVDIAIESKDIQVDVYRSSGCGGQSVNTTDSAVRITHHPTGIIVTCQDERSQIKNKVKAMKVLRSRLLDKARHDQESKISASRKSQVGSGDRSEKIRTYNFPDGRVTDHRVKLTIYNINAIMDGDLNEIISKLKAEDRRLQLERKAE